MERATTGAEHVRVLVVDDEPEIRRVLRALLTRSVLRKFHIEESPDGETALSRLATEKFDIILSDYRMRHATGIDVLEFAAEVLPHSGRILITAYGDLDLAADAVNRGRVSGFMRKPWDAAQLLALIESLVPDGAAARRPAPGIATPAARPAAPAAPAPRPTADLQKELEGIEHQLRQLRVRFGIGGLSAEGYRAMSAELRQRAAKIEAELMQRKHH